MGAWENAELVQAIRDLCAELVRNSQATKDALGNYAANALGLGGNAPLPPRMAANIPPPMPGLAASQAGSYGEAIGPHNVGSYGMPIGPEQYKFQMPSPLGQYKSHDLSEAGGWNPGMDALGAMPGLLAGAGNYAARKTPYGTTGTTDMLGQNLEMGMLKGLSDAAGKIPVIGEYFQNQFKGLEEAVYAPEERARGKLSGTFERMAMAGVDVSDREITEAFQFAIPIERRGVYMKQKLERIGAAVNAENGSALSGALSQIGL